MTWIVEKGVFCGIGTGFGKRISLKAIHKYPSAEFWVAPEDACVIYQKSEGRGRITTLCYSNLYPEEYKNIIAEGINMTLNKMKLITGQDYPMGFNEAKPKIDVELFAERMNASVMFKMDNYENTLAYLREIAALNPVELNNKRKVMAGLMKGIRKEKGNCTTQRQLRNEFNRSSAAKNIEITGVGSFIAKNSYDVDITDFVAIAEKRRKG